MWRESRWVEREAEVVVWWIRACARLELEVSLAG